MVERQRKRNRALKALQIAVECSDDPKEALATLDMARSAYGAFLGDCNGCRERRNWMAVAVIAVLAISLFEIGEKAVSEVVEIYEHGWQSAP